MALARRTLVIGAFMSTVLYVLAESVARPSGSLIGTLVLHTAAVLLPPAWAGFTSTRSGWLYGLVLGAVPIALFVMYGPNWITLFAYPFAFLAGMIGQGLGVINKKPHPDQASSLTAASNGRPSAGAADAER